MPHVIIAMREELNALAAWMKNVTQVRAFHATDMRCALLTDGSAIEVCFSGIVF